ncbi:hypothetical protein HKD37_19G053229 [Glycine soja]
MLLSSKVIQILVRVVMLVRMILTRLPAAVRAKSCPGIHSNWAMASSSNPSARFLLWPYFHSWPSSSTKGYPKNWMRASASNGIH